jgi:hypothetical protein
MDVDNAIDAIIFFLEGDVVLDCSQVVTDVLSGGGSGTGKNAYSHLVHLK